MLARALAILWIGGALLSGVGCKNGKEVREQATEPGSSPIGEARHEHGGPGVGEMAPTFSLLDRTGNRVDLADSVGKKTVAVVFWGTWCPHCRAEIPTLNKMQDAYREKGFQIVSVAVRDTAETVASFLKEQDINYTILLDEKLEVAHLYHIHGVPTVFVVDQNGVIQYTGHSAPQAEETVKALLERQSSSAGSS